jgi:hypothetical protein
MIDFSSIRVGDRFEFMITGYTGKCVGQCMYVDESGYPVLLEDGADLSCTLFHLKMGDYIITKRID